MKISIYILLLTAMVFNSCDKKLDIPNPAALDAARIFSTPANMDNAINSVYAQLQNGGLYGRDLFAEPMH